MTDDDTKPAEEAKPVKKKPAKKAKKKPAKKPAAKPKKKGKPLPKEIEDEYEAGTIEKFDVRGPTIVWVYTPSLFEVWQKKGSDWGKTQSSTRPQT